MTYFFCGKWSGVGEIKYISGVIENCSRIETAADYHALRDRIADEAKVDRDLFVMTALNPL